MSRSITANAKEKIARFNAEGLHYNIIANEIYNKHKYIDPFSKSFFEYIIAGLTVFDLGPRIGSNKYDFKRGFASRCFRHNKREPVLRETAFEKGTT